MKIYPLFLLLLTTTLVAQFDYIGKTDRDDMTPYQAIPVVRLTDRIVVLRHGHVAANLKSSETSPEEVVSFITGVKRVDSPVA